MATDYPTLFDGLVTNPLDVQATVIDEFTKRLGGNEDVIVDPNSPLMFLLEAFSQLTCNAVNATMDAQRRLYPRRATSMRDLFLHMSDYDYLGLYSTPAETSVLLYLDPAYLLENAPYMNEDPSSGYKKVVIPADTTFKISNVMFGLYYPITIILNETTRAISVTWDETVENPLYNLTQHTLEHRTASANGIDLLSIRIPIHQFVKITTLEDVSPTVGLTQAYSLTNGMFYAVRVFTELNGEWVELAQSLTSEVYDTTVATAIIQVLDDKKKLTLTIPQVYVTEGLVGSKVRVDIYTTQGKIDLILNDAESRSVQASFPGDSVYSTILTRLKTMFVLPGASHIEGGTNGITFDELKSRVVRRALTSGNLVTYGELESYFEDQGFTIVRYQDGITKRVYRCNKVMTDSEGAPIPAATLPMLLTPDTDYGPHILSDVDNSWMILPSAIFKYDPTTGYAVPLTGAERATLDGLIRTALPDEYNNNLYTYTPFHVKVTQAARYSIAYSYNLFNPTIANIEFGGSNAALPLQMSLYRSSIEHLNDGTGGYRLILEVWKSDDLADNLPETLHETEHHVEVLLEARNSLNDPVYIPAIYQGVSNKRWIFWVDFTTSYSFSVDHRIRFTNLLNVADETGHDLALTDDVSLIFMLYRGTTIEEVAVDTLYPNALPNALRANTLFSTLAQTKYPNHIQVSKQSLQLTFGRLLTETDNPLKVIAGELTYQQYPETVYATRTSDEYRRDLEGALVVNTAPGEDLLEILCATGDWLFRDMSVIYADVDTTLENATLTGFTSVDGILEGMQVVGPGIPFGTTVLSIDEVLSTVTMTNQATATATGVRVIIGTYPGQQSTYTVDATNGTAVLSGFESVSDIEVGMLVSGVGIPSGTRVLSIDTENDTVTLDDDVTSDLTDSEVVIGWIYEYLDYIVGVEVGTGTGSVLTGFEDVGFIYPGMCVGGLDIPDNAHVVSVDRDLNTVLLDVEVAAPVVSTRCRIGWPMVLHEAGDPILDAQYSPIATEANRELTYLVEAIHLDAKFKQSMDPLHATYQEDMIEQLNSYFDIVSTALPRMLENTELYFHPIRTIGQAEFTINGSSTYHDLQLQLALVLYVESSVYNDLEVRETVKTSILSIIDQQLQTRTLSCSRISKAILEQLSDMVQNVDILGVNGVNSKQTLISNDTSAYPCLAHQLVYNLEDGSLTIDRGLTISWIKV